MAGQSFPATSLERTNQFTRQMVKDVDATLAGEGIWTGAVNAVNFSFQGQTGVLSNEPANRFITRTPFDLIGAIHLTGSRWVLFSTDDQNCEIGIFDEAFGSYQKKVNDPGLAFKKTHLITGASKKNHDCSYSVYWADGLNPDRMLNLDKIPFKRKDIPGNGSCHEPQYTGELDIEALRITKLIQSPSLQLQMATIGGSLLNGSYQAVVAYSINNIRVTDYFSPSNVQSLFDHQNMAGALELEVQDMDEDFDEFELVLIATFNQQTIAKRIGYYTTRQKTIIIDQFEERLPTVPLEWIPLQTPAYEKSDAIFAVNDHLLRTGIYTRPDINWQPLVNKIVTKWVAVEVPADYYVKGGNLTSYLRDEGYTFAIRGIYNTGERTACYPIPGRAAAADDLSIASGQDVYEMQLENPPTVPLRKWQVENTASVTSTQVYDIPEGRVIAEGLMGYYESGERYPDDKPAVWKELCGQPLRHHRMPDSNLAPLQTREGRNIVLLGVKFENIRHPVDHLGNPVTSIVGYEILRASREGNRSIIAKGILNNVGEYTIPSELSDLKGLYPNFPFNDLRPNPFLSTSPVKGGCQGKGYNPLTGFRKDVFTFHSPETQFRHPFLNASELKIHGEIFGPVNGQFDPVYKHPRHQLIRDFALIVAGLVGVGTGLLAIKGKKNVTRQGPSAFNMGIVGAGATNVTTIPSGGAAVQGYYAGMGLAELLQDTGLGAVDLNDFIGKLKRTTDPAYVLGSTPGVMGGSLQTSNENTAVSELPLPLRIAGSTFLFTYFFSQGTEQALRIIKTLVPWQQYAYQYNGHGFYNQFQAAPVGHRRRFIRNSTYLGPNLQEFSGKYRVNNLYRSHQVLLETHRELEFPRIPDTSRTTIGERRHWDTPDTPFTATTSAFYASLKIPMQNQYGQLQSCNWLPVSTRVHMTTPSTDARNTSPVLFGGDIYINRYTEKNSFPLFNEWLHDLPDGTEWDYNQYQNIPYPRYWINAIQYEITNLTSALIRLNFQDNVLPNDFAHLDRKSSDCKSKVSFVINKAYFYLFVNGVRDFFVESEINLAHRDWGEITAERHYDPYLFTDLKAIFRSDIIRAGNHWKYDLSLSVSRLFRNYVSWGQILPDDYDPVLAEKCYRYYPKRVIYSLQQHEELKKDNWTAFLANNYRDFSARVTAIHPTGQSGAMIFLEDRSPVFFTGVDQLQTTSGTKITVGDGTLFDQSLNQISNADPQYAYGACNNRLSIVNTPAGLFWMSQEQGKIFQYAGQLRSVSDAGMRAWFNQYLPSHLLKDFPGFQLKDNPVAGIGCLAVYDSSVDMVYFSKRDYKLRDEYKGKLQYDKENIFLLRGRTRVLLGDPTYFEEAGWTLSYDPKQQGWISFHDWKPDYVLPANAHFLTVKNGRLWKHNDRCDLYCNYYGKDYFFEVEFPFSTPGQVTSLRNLEYTLECFQYDQNCADRHHLLDYNFDRAMVYNSEQHSGMLRLQPKPKNDPYALVHLPEPSAGGVDVYYAKEENQYRFNQFFDLTRQRGEFNDQYIPMWQHAPDGYHKQVNDRYITYTKQPLQRKKFRHHTNQVILRRVINSNIQMALKFVQSKHLYSFR